MDEEKPQQKQTPAKLPANPFGSPLYSIVQMVSVFVNINVILPMVLKVSWTGTMLEQGVFLLLFSTAFIVVSLLFLATAGYFAIMFVVAQNLRKLTRSDATNQDVAKAIAIRVLLSSQPRWLISLTPAVVPAVTLALISTFFYSDKLQFESNLTLLEACLLQGFVSFVLCLPFIIKTQKVFGTDVLANTIAKNDHQDS